MAMQMILCLETNKRANTDYIYIKEILNHFYQRSNQIKISPVYMGTKTKYRSNDTLKEMKRKIKDFTIGKTKVIYCIDTDEYEKNTEHANEFRTIQQFCEINNYDLIWFCHDVEEVFLGKRIPDSQKVQEAGAYRDRKGIQKINPEQLRSRDLRVHTSNILCVLDQYLARK